MVLSFLKDLASKWNFAYACPESGEQLHRLKQN